MATETTRERSLKNTEGLKEGISWSLIVETVLHGLPQMDQTYQYEFQTGTLHVKLRSDSEGAGNIARMTGLLRRVRHLELRVAYLQENIEAGRASVTFMRDSASHIEVPPLPNDRPVPQNDPVKIDGWKMTCPINMLPFQGFQGTFLSF